MSSTPAPTVLSPAAKPTRSLRWLVWCAPLMLAACSGPSAPQDPAALTPAEQSALQGGAEDGVYDGTDHSWTDEAQEGGTKLAPAALGGGDNVLSNEAWSAATNGWGPVERNTSNGENKAGDGKPLTLNGKKYLKGFGVHANSSISFVLGAQCKAFLADIGIDDEVGTRGSAVFQVFGDGVKLYDSGRVTGASLTKSVNVSIVGRKVLKLVVSDAGDNVNYDHADWASPVLKDCALPVAETPKTAPPAPVPPTPIPPTPPAAILPAPAALGAPSGPLVITRGGTYSGEYVSEDASIPVIKIKTSEPVILENCTLRGRGHLIDAAWSLANLTVRNCQGYGLNPNDTARFPGRFLNAAGIVSLLVENNLMDKTSGIYINDWRGDASLPTTIAIRNNLARNIEGRYSDGHGGFQDKFSPVQFVQFNKVRDIPRAEIAWNRVDNTVRQSHVEDVINIYDSIGTPGSPIRIHDNLINGAFSGRPDASYSGGGIMVGDGCNSGYTEAVGNTVLETSNYGIAVAGGHHQSVLNNTILGTGKLSDGTLLDADNDAGFYLRDYCGGATNPQTVVAQGNTVGWGVPNSQNPNARWDWSVNKSVGQESNNARVQATNRSVDPQLLVQAVANWERRAQAAGMVTGPR